MRRRPKDVAGLLASLVVLLLASGAGLAARAQLTLVPAASGNEIRARVDRKTDALRIFKDGTCRETEKVVTWSIAGPQGPVGLSGSPGPSGPSGAPGGFGEYGNFIDTVTQTNTSPGNPIYFKLRTPLQFSGVNVVDDTSIKVAQSGEYNITFSAQMTKTDGGTDIVYIWLRKNNLDVPWSNTGLVLTGSGAKQVAAWNFFVGLNAGESVELMWGSIDSAAEILAEGGGANPTRPEIPSLILTVNQVG